MVDPGEVTVPETLAGERVDRAVALLTGWSRRQVRDLVDDGAVLVDGRVVTRSTKLEPGQYLRWTAVPSAPGRPDGGSP